MRFQRRFELIASAKNYSSVFEFLFDRPDLARQSVPIAPDGSISYLQAVSVQAREKTIPELRKSIELALSTYPRDPKVIVTPAVIVPEEQVIEAFWGWIVAYGSQAPEPTE